MAFSGSDARFRALIEAAPDPIGVARGNVRVYANRAYARLLGYDDPEEFLGRTVLDDMHEADRPQFLERAVRRARGETLTPAEYRLWHRNGSTLLVEMTSMNIELDDGPALLVIMRDRTAYRRLEAELRQAERLASVGALAANVAHEINNPLAYVLTNIELLLTRDHEPAAARALLLAAREGAERVRTIASDLRTLARTDDHREGPIEIARATDAAIAITSHQLRGIEIARDHDHDVRVIGHEGRLVQVLANLLVNAAQADATRIAVATRRVGSHAEIVIEDDGRGIDREVLPRVFERFFSTKPRETGTGLGLPIAKDLVESMNGTITIDSDARVRGTTVRVRFPRIETVRPPPAMPRRRGRILLIDDEPAIGRALSLALEETHEVVAVGGGLAGVELLRRDPSFDVILCDVTMPDLPGPEVFAQVPNLAERFVFVTGGAPDRATYQKLEATGCPVLQKPFDLSEVTSLVSRRVNGERLG